MSQTTILIGLLIFFPIVSKTLLAGTSLWSALAPPNGTVRALAIDPQNPSVLYAGAEGGGVFKSTNGGGSWTGVSLPTTVIVASLAVDPQNPAALYAGTDGNGVFKSTNGGATWTGMNFGLAPGLAIAIVVDPRDPSTVYVAIANSGVFKSTSGAMSWTSVNSGLPIVNVRTLAIDPRGPGTIFAGTAGGGVFKSVNGAASWSAVNFGLTAPDIRALAIAPQEEATLYAGTAGGGVFRSTDSGTSWVAVNSGLGSMQVRALAIDPQDASTLYAGTGGGGVFKSVNRGASWSAANSGLTTTELRALTMDPRNRNTVYAVSDGGVFKTTNGAASWTAAHSGLTTGIVSAVAVDPQNPTTIYAGTDDGRLFKSLNKGTSWNAINAGLTIGTVLTLVIDPRTPGTLYAGGGGIFKTIDGGISWVDSGFATYVRALAIDPQNSRIVYAGTARQGIFKTTDGGNTWRTSNVGLGRTDVRALAVDPQRPDTLYAGTASGGIFKTTNAGLNWGPVNFGLTSGVVFALTVNALNPQEVYTGTDGGFFRSVNGGASWSAVESDLTGLAISALAVDPLNSGTVYAGSFSRGVFKSINGGVSWSAVNFGLTSNFIYALAVDPSNPRRVYTGTSDGGLFATLDSQALLFPFYRQAGATFTGFAVSNYGDHSTSLEFRSFGPSGTVLPLPANPSFYTLAPRGQLARLGHEIFGATPSTIQTAWVELLTDNDVGSLFQFGNGTQLAGSLAFAEQSRTLYFTRIFEGANAFRGKASTTLLSIANPNAHSITVKLKLWGPQANQETAPDKTRTIPARGIFQESVPQIFGEGTSVANGYVSAEVTEGDGAVGFGLVELPAQQALIGLNASREGSATTIYSAQLVSLPGIFTNIKLINSSRQSRTVTLTAVDDQGRNLSTPVQIKLDAGSSIEEDASQLFAITPGTVFVGTLRVQTDGPGVIGDVVFGDSISSRYAAAVPLQAEGFTHAVFSHVANGIGFYTGLALHNPGTREAEVMVEVFSDQGVKRGETNPPLRLAPGTRIARLLTELVPSAAGQMGGYVTVRSTQTLIGQQLFGSEGLLSAVVPTVVR